MTRSRRLSQRISEGDGIAVIACVDDADGARDAEAQGAKALAIAGPIDGIREATSLPLLWIGRGEPSDADAIRLRPEDTYHHPHLEPVVDVRDEDELELALEQRDPEIFLLAAPEDDDDADPLDAVLELLPDVPAGKLVVAELPAITRADVDELERAGVDAVIVRAGNIAELSGEPPPEV